MDAAEITRKGDEESIERCSKSAGSPALHPPETIDAEAEAEAEAEEEAAPEEETEAEGEEEIPDVFRTPCATPSTSIFDWGSATMKAPGIKAFDEFLPSSGSPTVESLCERNEQNAWESSDLFELQTVAPINVDEINDEEAPTATLQALRWSDSEALSGQEDPDNPYQLNVQPDASREPRRQRKKSTNRQHSRRSSRNSEAKDATKATSGTPTSSTTTPSRNASSKNAEKGKARKNSATTASRTASLSSLAASLFPSRGANASKADHSSDQQLRQPLQHPLLKPNGV